VTSITRFNDPTPQGQANPQTWRTAYDVVNGKPQAVTTPLARTTRFAYTLRGQVDSITSPSNVVSRFEYSAAGDLVRLIDPLGHETVLGYDTVGRQVTTTDALGYSTALQLNGVDQVTTITDALQQQTRLAYDQAQRLRSVTNPRNHAVETREYDDGDRTRRVIDALGGASVMDYDSAGRLLRITDRNGRQTSFDYDTAGRVISIQRVEGIQYFTYDAVGRLVETTDLTSTLRYEYDAVDRLVAETQISGSRSTRVQYTYDPLDRRTARVVTSTSPDGNFGPDRTEYAYDLDDRLTDVRYRGDGNLNVLTQYTYDADSRLTRKVVPNGISVDYSYDAAAQVTSMTYSRSDGGVIERIEYDYDAGGQRVARRATGNLSADETPMSAEYDAADRLTALTLNPGQPNQVTYALAYDGEGNLTAKTNTANSTDVTTYTWDSRNRLVQLNGNGLTASFSYDPTGRRIERRVTRAGQPIEITQYLYDGLQAVGELRLAQGSTTARQTSLITGLDLDEVLARVTRTAGGAQQRTYLTDALNSVFAQAAEDQSIVNRYGYSAYGQTVSSGDDEGNAVEYTGRENDGTGLYFYRARYYDPVLKRFASSDPIGLAGGANVYIYVDGNPISFSDPLGLCRYISRGGGTSVSTWTDRQGTRWTELDWYISFAAGSNPPDPIDISRRRGPGLPIGLEPLLILYRVTYFTGVERLMERRITWADMVAICSFTEPLICGRPGLTPEYEGNPVRTILLDTVREIDRQNVRRKELGRTRLR
jgi:RHS repeat-associated protein